MLPLHWITALYLLVAGLTFALPTEFQVLAWGVLVVSYLVLCVRGATTLTSKFLGPCMTRGVKSDGVALTYDDGPDATGTPAILALLAERGVKANFFCIGKHAQAHPDILRRIHDGGHLIGNHSHRHTPTLTIARLSTLSADLRACQDAIAEIVGAAPRFYRPPYGMRNHATHQAATRHGLRVVGWSASGYDTTNRSLDTIAATIFRDLAAGAIVLLHDRGPSPQQTLELTRRVLDEMDARGLHAVRLDEMV